MTSKQSDGERIIRLEHVRDAKVLHVTAKGAMLWRVYVGRECVDVWLAPWEDLLAPWPGLACWHTFEKSVADKIELAFEQKREWKQVDG